MRFDSERRFSLLAVLTGLIATVFFSSPTYAQDYPVKPVRIIVPFAPGGPADLFGRALAQRLQESLGQNFIVENKVGGGAIIGTDAAAKAAPDGYTLLLMSNTHTVNESLIAQKPYDLVRDFVPIAPINSSELLLVVHPSFPAGTLKELITLVKSKPGKYNYASSGPGTPYHMAGELFKAMSGTYIVHVPYRGSSGARTDVLGGQVEMMFDAITTMTDHVKSGRVKAIATSGSSRSQVLPDVPTLNEAGVPGYDATIWLGLMAPKGTPAALVEKLNAEIGKITSRPELRASWAKSGATALQMSTAEFARYINSDIRFKQVNVLSAGACKGLFAALAQSEFGRHSLSFTGSFGAVGAMQEKLLSGEACDLLVLTLPMLERLADTGKVRADTITVIGVVATGIAVRTGSQWPNVSSAHLLGANLLAARGIHFPDPARATAGVHFARVLSELGIAAQLADRCHHYPNGAAAMSALAAQVSPLQIGCTQISEILYTPGIDLVADLPAPFTLATPYAAALTRAGDNQAAAAQMLALLTGATTAPLRAASGFKNLI